MEVGSNPTLSTSTTIQTVGAEDIDAGTNAVPVMLDFDGDNKKDLLIGQGDGLISLYLNGTMSVKRWREY